MAVTADLDVSGEAEEGALVPRAAILRHNGQTWVYVQGDEEGEYEQQPIANPSLPKPTQPESEEQG